MTYEYAQKGIAMHHERALLSATMCGRVLRPNRRQIGLICTQPSGEITNGAAEQGL